MPIFSFELHFDLWLKPEKFCDSKSGLGCKVVTKNWGDRNITPWKMTDNLLCGSSCTEGVYIRHLATCEWEWASTCHPSLWSVWHFYQRLMWPLLLFGGFYSPHKARHEPPVYCPNAAFLSVSPHDTIGALQKPNTFFMCFILKSQTDYDCTDVATVKVSPVTCYGCSTDCTFSARSNLDVLKNECEGWLDSSRFPVLYFLFMVAVALHFITLLLLYFLELIFGLFSHIVQLKKDRKCKERRVNIQSLGRC